MGNEQLPSEGPNPTEQLPVHSEEKQKPEVVSVAKLLRGVMDVQAERVKTYSEFEQ